MSDKLKLSATSAWTLIRIFPIMFGDIFKNDLRYMNFIELIEIYRLLMSDKYNEELIVKIENKIEKHLENYKLYYPDKTIIAKQHFMVHYGRAIRTFGPPNTYSTMRFESKHSYFKRVYDSTHNNINITLSLATRHQYLQVYYLSSDNYFKSIHFGPRLKLDSITLDVLQIKFEILNFNIEVTNIQGHKWVEFRGEKYKSEDIVVFDILEDDTPCFGSIVLIIQTVEGPYLFLSEMEIVKYSKEHAGYILKDKEINPLISLDKLVHYKPLDLYLLSENRKLVVPKYPLLRIIK